MPLIGNNICTAPEAVADLSVDATSSSSLHVDWNTSSSCTQRFTVSWCAVQEGRTDPCYSRDVAADTTEFEISGVSGCTNYLVSVLAVGGTGAHSSSSALGLTGVTVPGSVEDLDAFVVDSDHFVVQWSPPVDNPNCAMAYSVCYTTERSKYEVCDNTHYTTWGNTLMVEACTNYSITVAALGETSSRSGNYTVTLLTGKEYL
uniref:Fibronectin type-III domain-containing protein n=1 Tax=Timema poppense TaxID=170557 RepID=A0A7R9DTI0_TIMPO|nr:unnamed protein product [Timema poppensis]